MATERRILRVELLLEVEALAGEELRKAGFFEFLTEEDYDADNPNPLDDYDSMEIGRCVASAVTHPDNEIFAGSDVYVVVRDARAVAAKWQPGQ